MWMLCVHIIHKHFQLLMRIKSDRNIINTPNETVTGIQTHNHLVRKRTRNHLAKLA